MSLEAAQQELNKAPKVNIKGKSYTTVATRVEVFRKHFPDHSIITTIMTNAESVCFRAEIQRNSIRPMGVDGIVLATGHAQETWGDGYINKTAALENAETSAIGRALANLGLHGGEFASADEIKKATVKSIRERSKDYHQDIMDCEELDQLIALTETDDYKQFVKDMQQVKPLWYANPRPHDGELWEEFIDRRTAELQEKEDGVRAQRHERVTL